MPAANAAAELVASTEERWADAAIAADCASEHLARLRNATSEQPHREVRWRQLVVGLAAAGLRTEALRAAGEARRALAEYGVLPCAELLDVERQLIGAEADLPVGAARVPARRDPLVGRDREMAEVLRPGAVVWVEGAPGTGKTRLLAEVADRSDGAAVVYVACSRPLSGWHRSGTCAVRCTDRADRLASPVRGADADPGSRRLARRTRRRPRRAPAGRRLGAPGHRTPR